MITFLQDQDIFFADTGAIVCPVNTVGIMGNGLAYAFKQRYPGLFEAYKKACAKRVFHEKGYFVFETQFKKKIVCFPTKEHWKNDSHIDWIRLNLEKLAKGAEDDGITGITFPMIGCGKGNLSWEDVKPVMIECLGDTELDVFVIESSNF